MSNSTPLPDATPELVQLAQLVQRAPVAMGIFAGGEHTPTFVNAAFDELIGTAAEDELPPVVWPEIDGQSFFTLVHHVFCNGERIEKKEVPITPLRSGSSSLKYYDFTFDVLHDPEGSITGTMVVATEVTELVQLRKDNEQRRQPIDDLLEQAPVAVSVYRGPNYIVEATNETACRLIGRTREESLNVPLFELLPEFADQGLEKLLDRVMATGEPYVAHGFPTPINRYGRHDTAYWDFIYYPYRNTQQEIVGVTVMGSEVTEQVLARQRVEREQRRLLNLFEQFPVGVGIYLGEDHIIEMVNATAGQLWGMNEKELLNKPLFEALPELREQGLADLLDEVYRTGEPFMANERSVSFKRKEKSGVSYFDFIYYPWRDQDNEIMGVISVAIDVTQQVAARQEEYRLRALLDNSTGFIGLADAEGKGVYLNPTGRDMVGVDSEASISRYNVQDFFAGKDKPFFRNTILPTLLDKEQGQWSGEYHFRHLQTQESITVLYNCFAVRDPTTDEIIGLGTVSVDISEQKQREKELQRYQKQVSLTNQKLAETNEKLATTNEELNVSNDELVGTNERLTRVNTDLDNFVYTASHDLKAPISNIQGLIALLEQQVLRGDDRTSPRVRKTLQLMEKSVMRFMRTIGDLSDIARLQRQDEEPEEPVDLSALIEEVRLDIAIDIERTGAQLEVDVEGCGPIHFSPKNLRSVVYNLLSNAVKYHDPQRPPRIRVQCKATNEHQILTVADNGLGIDPSKKDQLFGLFKRLHSHVEGTGIGLYIVKKVIENAGGKITVDSEREVGTTFTVCFRRN